jgi:CheY-like chemotaxis protein
MSLNILSVFDSDEAIDWLSTALAGHQLTKVKTIMAAMQVLQKDKIDVTLIQLHLHNESLFDLLRSIRRNDYYREMSFICCATSHSAHQSQIESEQFLEKSCILLGATKFLPMADFYSDNLEQEILKTLTSSGSRSGT